MTSWTLGGGCEALPRPTAAVPTVGSQSCRIHFSLTLPMDENWHATLSNFGGAWTERSSERSPVRTIIAGTLRILQPRCQQ